MKEELLQWISSQRDYHKGVLLLQKYHRNKRLIINISGNEKLFTERVCWEICKLAGYSIQDYQNLKQKPQVNQGKSKSPVKSQKKAPDVTLPAEMERLISELSGLVNERAVLHKKMADIPDNNQPENVAARKSLLDLVKKSSEKIELLSAAREDWYNKQKLPDFTKLYGKAPEKRAPSEMGGIELMMKKANLESSLVKDKNLLQYQTKTKQVKKNPMPKSPEREKIELRIDKKEKELEEILKQINGKEKA
jgi:hypothetical protein